MSGFGIRQLSSRVVRTNVTNGEIIRRITPTNLSPKGLFETLTDFVGFIFDDLVSFGGWIIGKIVSSISFSFTEIWGLIVQGVTFIYNFNWNSTDEQLDQYIKGMQNALVAQFGGTIGNLFGWVACGLAPSAGIFVHNELLGAYLLKQVGEEALDEFLANMSNLIFASARLLIQQTITTLFKNGRRVIKTIDKVINPASWGIPVLDKLLPDFTRMIDGWGEEGSKPWSFAIQVENAIESIPILGVQSFIEEFYEEFLDSCVEAGYVVAQGLDSWVLQQQMTADRVNGEQSVVEIQPDREIEDERIVLAGGQNHLRSQLPQVMANYHMIENRDIGQWVGETIRDSTRAAPSELTVRLILYSRKTPPYSKAKQSATITLHDFKRSKLDWDIIKKALGGKNGYTYGRFRATARLDSGRQLVVYASTEKEAEDRILELEKLVEPDIQTLSIAEEKKSGAKANGKPLQKEPIKIYPAYFYIQSKQRILNESTDAQGFQTLDGTWNSRRFTIELFPDEKPFDFEEIVADALRTRGGS